MSYVNFCVLLDLSIDDDDIEEFESEEENWESTTSFRPQVNFIISTTTN